MVLADGVVNASELEAMYRIGTERYGLTPDEINKEIMSAGTSIIVPETLEEKAELLYYMSVIAWVDKDIDEAERNLLCKYIKKMGFMPENVDAICDFFLNNVMKGMSLQEVMAAIKKL